MDNRTWLWRKKSSQKTIVAAGKVISPLRRCEGENFYTPINNEVGHVSSGKNLNEKLASVLLDCQSNNDFVTRQMQITQEAAAGKEKVEEYSTICNEEPEENLEEATDVEEKLEDTDGALKGCEMEQQIYVDTEEEKQICDDAQERKREYEKALENLESKLKVTNQQLADVVIENARLSKELFTEKKVSEELRRSKSQGDAEFDALMARLDSTEKENAFLRYEYRMLEKELEIRNEELEYNRRSADTSRKQHLESVKKVTMLEAECQRLHLLLRRRLPGPAALSNMRREAEMQGRDRTETRRRNQNPSRDLIVRAPSADKSTETLNKKVVLMSERLRDMEEENNALKEIVIKKTNELHSSRIMHARTASRLSHVESKLGELSKDGNSMQVVTCNSAANELSLSSCPDISGDDGISSSGSWANALMSELENFRINKSNKRPEQKAFAVPDMHLMDDFAEMEKLAIVPVDTTSGNRHDNEKTSRELVPVSVTDPCFHQRKKTIQSKDMVIEKPFDWLQVVLSAMMEQKRVSNRSLDELFMDIRIALGYINYSAAHHGETGILHGGGSFESLKTPFLKYQRSAASTIESSMEEKISQHGNSRLSEPIRKLIRLVEGVDSKATDKSNVADNRPDKGHMESKPLRPETSSDYFVHVFQWKNSDLTAILRCFIHTCNDLLEGKVGFEKFAEEVTFTLDWLLNNCSTPGVASSVRDKIKKHLGMDESLSEKPKGLGCITALETVHSQEELSPCLKLVEPGSRHKNCLLQFNCNLKEETDGLKAELKRLECTKRDVEASLLLASEENKVLTIKLEESEKSIGILQAEVENLKESKSTFEDQIENQKMINEDLDTQLTVAKAKLNEIFQKFSSLEVELENKSNCCEELEATCLDLQLQLESIAKQETPNNSMDPEEKQSHTGWELTIASARLAECQETVLSLGKQLKELSSPKEAAVTTDATTTAGTRKNPSRRSSLRDRMMDEDDSKALVLLSPTAEETEDAQKPSFIFDSPSTRSVSTHGAAGVVALLPGKKQGGFSFLRKLLLRRKKGSNKTAKMLTKV